MKNGFTLIELMIVIAVIGIISAIVIPALFGNNQIKDHRCVAGYAFTFDGKQVMSEQGKGVPCETNKIGMMK